MISDDIEESDLIKNHLLKANLTLDDIENAPILWHYTNIESLFGMIESESIWLSDHRSLNDKNEIVYAKRIIHDRYCESLKWGALVKAGTMHLNQHDEESMNNPVFVASFSGMRDKLSQWKGYGSGANGVSIGFDTFELLKQSFKAGSNLLKVRYHEHEIIPQLDALIATYRELIDNTQDQEKKKKFEFDYWFVISAFETVIKMQQWEEEEEYRITARTYIGNTKYRIVNGSIRPYKEMKFNPQSCLREIITSDSDPYKKKVLNEYLSSKMLSNVIVSESALNMRFC